MNSAGLATREPELSSTVHSPVVGSFRYIFSPVSMISVSKARKPRFMLILAWIMFGVFRSPEILMGSSISAPSASTVSTTSISKWKASRAEVDVTAISSSSSGP